MPAVFKHGKYASLIQHHSYFSPVSPKQAIASEIFPFSCLIDQLLDIHATVNI